MLLKYVHIAQIWRDKKYTLKPIIRKVTVHEAVTKCLEGVPKLWLSIYEPEAHQYLSVLLSHC